MKKRVEWLPSAEEDLVDIFEFIADENPLAAERLVARVEHSTDALASYPRRGRVVPELAELGTNEFREAIVPPLRVVYVVVGRTVQIVLGPLHEKRDAAHTLLRRIQTLAH